jgi:hypothetical protein
MTLAPPAGCVCDFGSAYLTGVGIGGAIVLLVIIALVVLGKAVEK